MPTPQELRQLADKALVSVAELSEQLVAYLAAEVDVELPPAPSPAPAPAPVPTPAPAPANPAPALTLLPITGSVAISCCGWNEGGATYDRFQRLVEWVNGKGELTIWRSPLRATASLPTRTYTVTVGGTAVGEVAFPEGKIWAKIAFSTLTLPDDWLQVKCIGLTDDEFAPVEWANNLLSDKPRSFTPKWQDSHHHPGEHSGFVQASCVVPAVYSPRAVPLAPREFLPVTATTRMRAQVLTALEPSVQLHTPNMNKRGTVSTCAKQSYFWGSMLLQYPDVPLLDGPRGVGRLPLVTHIKVGLAAPDGTPRNTWYASTSWGWVRGRPDGSFVTLVGWRHKGMASYFDDGAAQKTLELVGDWRCSNPGFFALRSFDWDQASLAVDESLPRIPGEDGAPHPTNIVAYAAEQRESCIADKFAGRITRIEFSNKGHDIPPVVTEFMGGLRGSWGVVDWGDKIIVSERNANRIITIDKATKAITTLLAADPTLPGTAAAQQNSVPAVTGTLEERRTQPCLAPEDLEILDGFLYFSSRAAECIKRFDLTKMELDPDFLFPVLIDRQSWAVKFAMSDGTVGPRGTIFYNTWGQVHHAGAFGTQPDGTRFTAHAGTAPWYTSGYPFGIAVGKGRMYGTASNIGMTRWSAALPDERPINLEAYRRGREAYDKMHGGFRFGPAGFGDFGHDLPWGENGAADYYLSSHDLPGPAQ